jgi:hypothetical protein
MEKSMNNYAKENEVKPGTVLIADGGFTCIKGDTELTVEQKASGLAVPCAHGAHFLDGSLNSRKEYIGFRLKSAV